jgi:hypothetical protein
MRMAPLAMPIRFGDLATVEPIGDLSTNLAARCESGKVAK